MVTQPQPIEKKIKAEALRLGFCFCGITSAGPTENFHRYQQWLDQGFHGGMKYLDSERHIEQRRNPALLLPEAKSILSLGWKYPIRKHNQLQPENSFWVAGYVSNEDYHFWIPEKLDKIAAYIKEELNLPVNSAAFTDSAPLLEREIACRAGLGWIGRNSCLISPQIGSAFLLSEILIDQNLQADAPFTADRCGSCTKCIQACPTHCIQPDRTIDSRRCISFHTIENHAVIPQEIRPAIGNWLFGCDICQMVCPWNQKHISTGLDGLLSDYSLEKVQQLLEISPEQFKQRFEKSALLRVKWKGLMRNVLICLANSKEASSRSSITRFISTQTDPMLCETAEWALKQIDK